MKREWKPGDVAMVSVSDLDEPQIMLRDKAGWADREATFYWDKAEAGWEITDVRPLVVIDPEDAEQIGRLAEAWEAQTHATLSDTPMTLTQYRLQAALRSLITPPKPEEPTGLGAVVEDAEGYFWIRSATSGGDPWRAEGARAPGGRSFHTWSDIVAVKVLSEGVTP